MARDNGMFMDRTAGEPFSMQPLLIGIIIAALVTLGILLAGVMTMARGQDITGRKSNRLMMARVLAQGVTVVLIVIFIAVVAGG